ncbi:MAG: SUMF1/EgtB/PvdO family nonheme iron enzyme [Alphaproteobacteria bacterium]|nr:SUMF1/EgtB/PvdO family nonheme iron enzyme [Alphaproteobacteria bacterium]
MTRWGDPASGRSGDASAFLTLVASSMEQLDSLPTLDEPTEIHVPVVDTVVPELIGARYERRELLGKGGMGEVWRVYDRDLRRTVALKVLHTAPSERTWLRFEEEARVAAQLQHPGIIPVYDLGRLEDGRLWFTMKEVRGRTLEELIVQTHREWRLGRTGAWTFRRLLEGFHRVCETMAYAHARGVVHRDIKPSNVMFGDYGEVLVLDWGLAKVLSEAAVEDVPEGIVDSSLEGDLTAVGVISGTPNYMSPEQAQGRSAEAGPAADVFSLGATLYDLLAERPPRVAQNVRQLIMQVAMGRPAIQAPSVHVTGAPRDDELDAMVLKALEVDEDHRYPHAGGLAADLARWLDGALKRERAMALVVEARADLARSDALAQEGERLMGQAECILSEVPRDAAVAIKVPAWELQDTGKACLREAADTRNRAIQTLRASLTHAPDLPEAHRELASEFARRHRQLEASDQHDQARIVASDVALHDRAGEHAAYLKGTGALTLITDRPVEVLLHRYVELERRLQPVFERSLGTTPLTAVPLEMGSYLLLLRAEDGVVVRYPVWIRRQEHWDGIGPGMSEPSVIVVPRPGEVDDNEVYVAQGWFWAGDEEFEHTLPLQRAWTDAFVIGRYPVTVGEYADHLNALLDAGEVQAATEAAPVFEGDDAEPYLEKLDDRYLRRPRELSYLRGWERSPNLPQTVVTHTQATVFAAFHGRRLPSELEWQHAARGADRRLYPWGNHMDPSWCQMRFSPGDLLPVGARSEDRSPYGVEDCAGNAMDWTRDLEGQRPVAVGGNSSSGPRSCYVSNRSIMRASYRMLSHTFRIARSW